MGGWRGPRTPASARRWGWMVLSWPAPSISGGSGLACAVIPPAPPSDVFWYRGSRCAPGGGWATCTLLGEGVWLWPAPSFSEGSGLACAASAPAPPSDVFRNRGTPPVLPAGVGPPAPCLGRGFRCDLRPPSAKGLAWRAPLSHPLRPLTFLETGGHPLHPLGGGGLVVACALLQGRVRLGLGR